MGKKYRISYKVPFYEVDINKNIKLPQLLSIVLHVSGLQSLELGISDDTIFKNYQLVWVITEYDITINRLPKYDETITIETEATAYNKLFCYRDFTIYDVSGQVLIVIHSTFVLMDYQSRKVHPVIEELVAVYGADPIKKIKRGPKYSSLSHPDETLYRVRFFDLDLNGHVNNSKYLEWMLDVLEEDVLRHQIPQRIHLKYVKEVRYGHDILSQVQREGHVSQHTIVSEGTVRAQAMMTWQEKD